jgi:predicted NUDIX family NTP pyrophosphohydrolase
LKKTKKISSFRHLELLANQIVEGFISGMHSPFHGFSAEFAEHSVYNVVKAPSILIGNYLQDGSLVYKAFEEETNLRCHIIIDNSSSMHYPQKTNFHENKIGFSVWRRQQF